MINVKNSIRKQQNNFWNHVHFHPTDAIEDDWGQKILNEVAKDKVAKVIRMYAMLEDIVTMDENGNFETYKPRGSYKERKASEEVENFSLFD